MEIHDLRLLLYRLLDRSGAERRRQGGGRARRGRRAGQPGQALHQGHFRARAVQFREPRQDAAPARARDRRLPRGGLGRGARLHRRRDPAHPGEIRARQHRHRLHRTDPDRRVLYARQADARGHRHQQLRRQHHSVHGLGCVRLQALVRLRRAAGLLRRLRAHRMPAGVRLQPARAASDHLLAPEDGAGEAQVPGDRRRSARHHVCANGGHSFAGHARHRPGAAEQSRPCDPEGRPAGPRLHRSAHQRLRGVFAARGAIRPDHRGRASAA